MLQRVLFYFFITTIIFVLGCNIQKPKVEDISALSVGYSHTPIPTTCITCHVDLRPNTAKTLSTDNKSDLFLHTSSYNGDGDCLLCHTQTQEDIGVTWRSGVFNHKSNSNSSVTTCRECHLANMPSVTVGTSSFDHGTTGSKECVECHKNTGANWSTTNYSHSPMPATCNSCHYSSRPNPVTYYPYDSTKPTLSLYAHATGFNGAADCVSCHTEIAANAGVSWAGAKYNHTTSTGAIVSTCSSCHTGNRPTSHTSASGQLGDCVTCHTKVGVDWTIDLPTSVNMQAPAGTSLSNITIKHPTVQSGMTCSTCHSGYSSTNSIVGFDHAEGLKLDSNNTAVSNSCYYCHFSPSKVIDTTVLTTNTSRTFILGKIVIRSNSHHGETLSSSSSCLNCHSASTPNWNSTSKTWTTGGKWNGG